MRAHARAAQRLIQGFASLHHHRGCQPTELGAALAVALIRLPDPPPGAPQLRDYARRPAGGSAAGAPISTPTPAPPPRADAALPAPRRAADAPASTPTPAPPTRADAALPRLRELLRELYLEPGL